MSSSEFETAKNIKAGTITGVITGLLLLFFFLVSWSVPVPPPPPVEEGMEVNLGNSDDGLGNVQPLIPGPPAAAQKEINAPPKAANTSVQNVKAVETDDNDKEAEDVHVPKPKVSNTKSTNIPTKENTNKASKPQVVENPAPPKPKATYKGGDGTGPGGNNADTWNNSRSEGNTTGLGDRGKINGDPNSKNYDGFGGSGNGSGYTIQGNLRGRSIVRQPSFQDEFNENAKVAVDISVDASGAVTGAAYQPRGSTTSDAAMKDIAIRKAKQLKFAAGSEDRGTIIFNFKVTN
jgi:outer membrane biosynthesis protein TonB